MTPATLPAAAGAPPTAPAAAASAGLYAAAAAVAILRTPNDNLSIDEAVTRLAAENRALLAEETGATTLLQALAAQLSTLEAIFYRYTLNAEQAKEPERAAAYMKIALTAQGAFMRAASALLVVKTGERVLPQ